MKGLDRRGFARRMVHSALLTCGALVALGTTGCQVDVGGLTLPSPNYHLDDVQYFPAGPEFKLSREAAAMKAFKQEAAQREAGPAPVQ